MLLDGLIGEIATGELYDLQERYGLLFDRTRSLALHLFEHVHGESRDRGQAMVDLKTLYEKAGSPPRSEGTAGFRAAVSRIRCRHARSGGCA
jgi:nitrate reductase molybdenum cofactor assembly chaperone